MAQLKLGQSQGKDQLMTLESEKVAVIGAGRMSRLLLQHLQAKGCSKLTLLNRSMNRAESLASDFPDLEVECGLLDGIDHCLQFSTLVFTSTSSETPIINAERLNKFTRNNVLRLIDIGVPRNIAADVTDVSGFEAHDVDDLQEVVDRNQDARKQMAKEAETLIEDEARIFLEWWASLEAVPTINRLRSGLEAIRKEELQKALSRMGPDFSARERKVVEALSKGIINKILHTPVTNLRAPQPSSQRKKSLEIVESLFDLDVSNTEK